MIEGDNAFGGGTGEVRRGTLVMMVVGAPAVPARACIRTIITVMSWVFAMAFEAIWVGRKAFLSFAQQRLGWSAWLNHSSLL